MLVFPWLSEHLSEGDMSLMACALSAGESRCWERYGALVFLFG